MGQRLTRSGLTGAAGDPVAAPPARTRPVAACPWRSVTRPPRATPGQDRPPGGGSGEPNRPPRWPRRRAATGGWPSRRPHDIEVEVAVGRAGGRRREASRRAQVGISFDDSTWGKATIADGWYAAWWPRAACRCPWRRWTDATSSSTAPRSPRSGVQGPAASAAAMDRADASISSAWLVVPLGRMDGCHQGLLAEAKALPVHHARHVLVPRAPTSATSGATSTGSSTGWDIADRPAGEQPDRYLGQCDLVPREQVLARRSNDSPRV